MLGVLGILSLPFWLSALMLAVYCITVLSIVVVVIGENRSPVRSLAWITVLLLLPVAGVVLYAFFGRSLKHMHIKVRTIRLHKRGKTLDTVEETERPWLGASTQGLANLGESMCEAKFFQGGDVKIYTFGKEKFADLKADLRAAKRYINLQYYIFLDDVIGKEIGEILMERARSGVKVRVSYDEVGSWSCSRGFVQQLRKAGVEAQPFVPVAFPRLGTQINWRNHRKIVIIDGEVGYLGGMNIADRYVTGGHFDCWRDTHLRVTGQIVKALQRSFAADWSFVGRPEIDDPVPEVEATSHAGMQLVTSGPVGRWSNVGMMFMNAIGHANRRIFIQTPYFLPTESLLDALCAAALSQVDVRIMLPKKSDSRMLDLASHSFVKQLLLAGVKVYFYQPGMMHSKLMIVDEEIATVGSTNFDFRSFEHNFECNLFMYDLELTRRLASTFEADQKECVRVDRHLWMSRGKARRALESVARLFSPIL